MREILFRGFTPDEKGREKAFVNGEWIKGQWVKGSYMTFDKTTYCFKKDYEANPENTEHYIVIDEMTDWGLPNRHLQADVFPETIGQYTGLTDRNGKRIFEGDIITDNPTYPYPTNYIVYMDEDRRGYYPFACGDGCGCCESEVVAPYNCEVIGNIHDNPELAQTSRRGAK